MAQTNIAMYFSEVAEFIDEALQSGGEYQIICKLFMTSKNETKNSPIHQFTNLKCCKMSFKAFEKKKQGLNCFLKVINKK